MVVTCGSQEGHKSLRHEKTHLPKLKTLDLLGSLAAVALERGEIKNQLLILRKGMMRYFCHKDLLILRKALLAFEQQAF